MTKLSFSRYTDLPSLVHILTKRELTLLDPMSWDDKNDSNFITLYREKCRLKSVLALCFSQASETYHHWRIFAPSSSGVCIRFGETLLREAVARVPELQLKPVTYLKMDEIRSGELRREALPFLKRYPFQPESEVRMLWESATEERHSLPVPIDLAAIRRITLSPWLHPSLVDCIKSMIKSIDGCSRLNVYRSTLVSNADWLKQGRAAT
jgi:hypothetical protein